MSAVELQGVRHEKGNVILKLGGVDLVDGTPIVDIKPYIPYSDSLPQAQGGFASSAPDLMPVCFNETALNQLPSKNKAYYQTVISEVLAQDPRPAYKKGKPDLKQYAVHLFDFNVHFSVTEQQITVNQIEKVNQ